MKNDLCIALLALCAVDIAADSRSGSNAFVRRPRR